MILHFGFPAVVTVGDFGGVQLVTHRSGKIKKSLLLFIVLHFYIPFMIFITIYAQLGKTKTLGYSAI